jgi:hypothetical protein
VRLPARFLEELLPELDGEEVEGIILGGSHARGNATALSDVDIALFVRSEAQLQPRRYFYRRGLLVSVTTKTIAGVRAAMTNPQAATRVVPGISQSRVLLDKGGSLAALMEDLARFSWEPMQERANRHVSDLMYGLVETVHKLANEVVKGNEAGVAYIMDKLLDALTEAVVIQRGVMIQSDSTYYRQAQEAVGTDSEWTEYHRRAAGLTGATLEARAKACLYLHRLTLDLVRPAMIEEHIQVVEQAARRVAFVYA